MVVRSSRDTWRLIKSGRHLGYRDFEIQGSTPFHPRYVRCEGAFGCGPMVIAQGRMERWLEEEERELPVGESLKGSGPLVLKDVWCLIKSGRYLTYRDFERQGSTPFHPRYVRCEGAFGCGPTVIAQGQGMEGLVGGRGARTLIEENPERIKGGLVSKEGTWRLIKSGRYLTYRDFEIQGSTPSHPRYARCEGAFGCGPTVIAQGRMEWGQSR
jgi:hypothetical protein